MSLRFIVSPAKKMRAQDAPPWPVHEPAFLERAETLMRAVRALSRDEAQALWGCSDRLADLNYERFRTMDLGRDTTAAVISYEGIQYRYMAPGVFTGAEFAYIQEHLRILSGFYGLLRPFDGVTPYRLEMQAKLAADGCPDLYSFWGDRLARQLFSESGCILNLASREYSVCVSRYLPPSIRFLTCVFGEEQGGRVVEKGTLCKMARGEMVRYLAENQVMTPDAVTAFDRLGYRYAPAHSDESTLVFLRRPCAAEAFSE